MPRPLVKEPDFVIDAALAEAMIRTYRESPVIVASCEAIRAAYPHVQVSAIKFSGFSKPIICPQKEEK